MSYAVVFVDEKNLAGGEHKGAGPFQTHADAVRWVSMWPWPDTLTTLIVWLDEPRFALEAGEVVKKTQDEIENKAVEIWRTLTANERHGVQFGLFPSAKMPADNEGYGTRRLSVALMDLARTK